MKAKYNLIRRRNPAKREETELLWYAVPICKGRMGEAESARVAVADTTLSRGEYKFAMELACEKLVPLALGGVSVTLGGIGTLRLSFGSRGVARPEDFDPRAMIQNARFVFRPSKELREALAAATFELADLVEDGVRYPSLRGYRQAKGQPAEGE